MDHHKAYTQAMVAKLLAKMQTNPEAVFNALGKLEQIARTQAEIHAVKGEHSEACAMSDAARTINVCREWCPSW